MFTFKGKLIQQRLNYFAYGNFHGVSANWLAKKCDQLSPSATRLISDWAYLNDLEEKYLEEGAQIFLNVLNSKSGSNYGKNFDCEVGLASFLYAYILTRKPQTLIETGVANGITTNVIMSALEKSGGVLHSFDVDPKTSNVYSGLGNWRFHLLSGNLKKNLVEQVGEISEVDLWLHDSNHGYLWQSFEFQLAKSVLKTDGILVSDDIDSSTAWGSSADSLFKESYGVFDERKFFGVARV
jgi:predicted O-methyltransferase YrrM